VNLPAHQRLLGCDGERVILKAVSAAAERSGISARPAQPARLGPLTEIESEILTSPLVPVASGIEKRNTNRVWIPPVPGLTRIGTAPPVSAASATEADTANPSARRTMPRSTRLMPGQSTRDDRRQSRYIYDLPDD
jgi:hypothetical protein